MFGAIAYAISVIGTLATIALRVLGADDTVTFGVAALTILGLAYTLGHATEQLGIAGLDPKPWEAAVVGGNQVWVRPEDNATAAGTHIYTWSSGEFVFLLIGVDDALNRAIVEQLPGQPAPTPSPIPSTAPSGAGSPSATPSASEGD